MFRVNNKDTKTKPIGVVTVSFDVNQNVNIFTQLTESKIEIKPRKKKIYCLLWTDFTTCPNDFIVDFEQISDGWEAKGDIDDTN